MAELKHVQGLSELQDSLRALAPKIRKRLLAQSVGATGAAGVIKKEAIDLAPEYHGNVAANHPPPGTLKKSIVAKQWREQSNDTRVTYLVGVSKKLGAFYWWWVEFGTAKMSARQFLRPALQNKAQEAIDKFADKVRAGLQTLQLRGKD